MKRVESGYTLGRNNNGLVIKVSGELPLAKVLKHLEKASTDTELKGQIRFADVKNAVIDASTRLAVIISSGGIISTEGNFAFALPTEAEDFPNFPGKFIYFHPDFAKHLRVTWKNSSSKTNPFFYLQGRNSAQILVNDQIDAMVNLTEQTYVRFGNPYPRINSRSVVNQILLSSIAHRDARKAKI